MAEQTTNFKFTKDSQDDFFNVETVNNNFDILDSELKKVSDKVNIIQKASGTGTAVELAEISLEDGFQKTFIATSNNGGSTTKINGKNLYKPGSTVAPNLVAGKAYTIWYDSTGGCFFVKASTEGDADVANVLAGKTFSNNDDIGLSGTMPNKGAVNKALAINETYPIPKGYHDGNGQVTQSITSKSATSYIPGTIDQVILAGQYLSGNQTIKGDANLVSSKILLNNIIFGVPGTGVGVYNCAQISGLAGTFGSTIQGQVTLSLTNPTDGLFKGVRIMYKTGSYPSSPTDGTVFYDNNGSDAIVSSYIKVLTEGVTYYFRAFAYTYQNATRQYITTTAGSQISGMPYRVQGSQIITSSSTFTVPANVVTIDVFIAGGGGAGGNAGFWNSWRKAGGGGGGGYTFTQKNINVTPGQQIPVVVGAGGVRTTSSSGSMPSSTIPSGGDGGVSSFGIYSANGGKGGGNFWWELNSFTARGYGGNGGSAGGDGGLIVGSDPYVVLSDCSPVNGGNDGASTIAHYKQGCTGQGTTTKAFAETTGTVYSGGGGGGVSAYTDTYRGYGGSGGGGNGGHNAGQQLGAWPYITGYDGSANTGGGGGGATSFINGSAAHSLGGNGGSGIVIIRWGY